MIGPRLKSARLAAGFTQSALSVSTGISQAHISQMESGDRQPSLDMVRVLAAELGVAPGYLLGETVADMSTDYLADPRAAIVADYESPPGLRDLASDAALVQVLSIQAPEWAALRSLAVPSPPNKDGYLVLLHVLRAVCPR